MCAWLKRLVLESPPLDGRLPPTQRLLLRLARVELTEEDRRIASELARDADWNELFSLTQRGGIAGMVARHLDRLAPPTEVRLEFLRASLLTEQRNRLLVEEAVRLCAEAEQAGLTLVPLKGSALNLGLPYHDLSMRSMCDLDLLTRREQVADLDRFLTERGYRLQGPPRDALERYGSHLGYLGAGQSSVRVELHWTALGLLFGRPEADAELLQRTRLHSYGGLALRVLDRQASILGVLLHLAGHRYGGQLKWLVDLNELSRSPFDPFDWSDLWGTINSLGATRACAHSVLLARDLLQAPIPLARPASLLSSALWALAPPQLLVTGELPRWRERLWPLISFAQNDSPWDALRFLLYKGTQSLEHRLGVRLPRLVSHRLALR